MIKVEKLSYSYPEKDLYTNISFTLEEGQHCAFIGTSGTGKSTLVNILRDPEEYLYDGKVTIAEGCTIGYVSQFPPVLEEDVTVFDYLADVFVTMIEEQNRICDAMATADDLDSLLEEYQQALDAFAAIGGDDYENTIMKKLNLANLGKHKDVSVSKLSGGEFKLLQVIKEMLTMPSLMIMDEPDVFLDFAHLNSLMNLINSHKGTLLVITHNRYLLNHCFNKILHLENKEIQEFDGRYIDYNFSLLQAKIEMQEVVAEEEAEIARNEEVVNKLRAAATYYTDASRGRALHARVSLLERLKERKIKAPFVEIKQPDIQLSTTMDPVEGAVLSVENYGAAFEQLLLENVSFELQPGEKVAIIGANGTGKTTLLRDIFKNQHEAIRIAEGTCVDFVSQSQGERLNESGTIADEFFAIGFESYDAIKEHLGRYGFDGEIISQKVGQLSGGEKNLIQLAKVAAGNANLLLLDEPTSHLDTYSQLALEEAIASYNGAVLMISHDFYTIVNCMDYALFIEDNTIRKISMRKFRKMIYANHFDKDYLELEQKKKTVETRIARALQEKDFERAKEITVELENLNKLL